MKIGKMFRIIKISFVLVILIENLNAQIHLNKTNLAVLCNFDPMKLTSINLAAEKIKTIDPATFTDLISLQKLNLGYNRISSIDPATFTGLTSLRELNLESNQISSIDTAIQLHSKA